MGADTDELFVGNCEGEAMQAQSENKLSIASRRETRGVIAKVTGFERSNIKSVPRVCQRIYWMDTQLIKLAQVRVGERNGQTATATSDFRPRAKEEVDVKRVRKAMAIADGGDGELLYAMTYAKFVVGGLSGPTSSSDRHSVKRITRHSVGLTASTHDRVKITTITKRRTYFTDLVKVGVYTLVSRETLRCGHTNFVTSNQCP